MFSKSWIVVVTACLVVALAFKGVVHTDRSLTIGILQTASHPALDLAREGFMAEMQERSPEKIEFVVQNAEGSLIQAQSIAENFHAHKKICAIFALGTAAVQAAAKAEKEKPIFIAAVSDPQSLGILRPGTNICGTTDQVNTDEQADLIVQMLPTVETVVILFNPSENNSQIMVKKMQSSLEKRGIKNCLMGAFSAGELPQVLRAARGKGEALLVPNDNLIAGNIVLVAKEASAAQSPLFVSDIALVEKGALAARGADYADMGRETAQIAHRVLFQALTPEEAGIAHPSNPRTVINKNVAARLQIQLPEEKNGGTK